MNEDTLTSFIEPIIKDFVAKIIHHYKELVSAESMERLILDSFKQMYKNKEDEESADLAYCVVYFLCDTIVGKEMKVRKLAHRSARLFCAYFNRYLTVGQMFLVDGLKKGGVINVYLECQELEIDGKKTLLHEEIIFSRYFNTICDVKNTANHVFQFTLKEGLKEVLSRKHNIFG